MNQTLPPTSSNLVAGKYQLVRRIGQGGMGSVWEARHASLGTRVAIKFIEADYADNTDARSRFDREARAAASIQSKHAIQIFDHGVTEDGKPYIVMEMLSGEPFDKRIQRLGRMPLPDAARVLQQVGRALAQAHEKGIVHRDLKPENIFLVSSPDDDDEIAKVLDFGIAKIQAPEGSPGLTSSTKTGAVLGTPYYMSPEQARGLRNVDHRTDVWSIGVIAFRAVTGRLPFEGESVGDLLVKICTSPLPVPSQVAPGLPPAFDAWFMRALERDPNRRFATIAEATEALAFSAGLATRRPGQTGPITGPAPMVPTAALAPTMGQTPPDLGSPGTAAPFTANARESRAAVGGSSALLFGAIGAGVVVLGISVSGIYMLARKRQSPPPATVIAAVPAPVESAAPPPTMEPLAPSAPIPAASAGPTLAKAVSAAGAPTPAPSAAPRPAAPPGKPGKPGAAPSASAVAPPPGPVAPPPAPVAPPPPAPPKPKGDPLGY